MLCFLILTTVRVQVVSKVLLEACRSNKWHYPKDGSFTLKQGAGNNWAAGYLEHAEEGLGHISDLIRQRAEKCDWIDGFFPILSLAGGTGSGLGTRITESLRDDYPHTSLVNAVGIYRPLSISGSCRFRRSDPTTAPAPGRVALQLRRGSSAGLQCSAVVVTPTRCF